MPEFLPACGTVDITSVIQLRWHGLQPGEKRNSKEGNTTPRVHHNDGEHGPGRIAEPPRPPKIPEIRVEEPLGGLPEPAQPPVKHAERGIEHPYPGQTAEHSRDNEW